MYLTFYYDFWLWLIQTIYKMRTKFSGILTLLLVLVVQLSFAQEKSISGTVTDNSGLPLPGVAIRLADAFDSVVGDLCQKPARVARDHLPEALAPLRHGEGQAALGARNPDVGQAALLFDGGLFDTGAVGQQLFFHSDQEDRGELETLRGM